MFRFIFILCILVSISPVDAFCRNDRIINQEHNLLDSANNSNNVWQYGARGDGVSDNGLAFSKAISDSRINGNEIIFPLSQKYYVINTGLFPNTMLGRFVFNENVFSGSAIGDPGTGKGKFNSTYTNPWNITTGVKWVFDPASVPQKDNVTNQGVSIECLPNHLNISNQNGKRNWIACVYRGIDTGSGGSFETSLSSEVGNDVMNIGGNSGTVYEVDLNFNKKVSDGGISRGVFITGGGVHGNYINSVALDIQHGGYDGSYLPWSTGISVRDSINMLQLYAGKGGGVGFFLEAYDINNHKVVSMDKNGYASFSGLSIKKGYTPDKSSSCEKGAIMSDDDYLYVCTSAGRFKKVALSSL